MKTEGEISQMTAEMKDSLVNASGEGVLLLQGFIRALNWVVSDERDDAFSEDEKK